MSVFCFCIRKLKLTRYESLEIRKGVSFAGGLAEKRGVQCTEYVIVKFYHKGTKTKPKSVRVGQFFEKEKSKF